MTKKLKRIALIAFTIPLLLQSCNEKMEIAKSGILVPYTADEDSSIPSITVNGIKIHAESFGPKTGNLIIMIHGGPGGDYRYLLHAKDLINQGYQVVFYDQRGAGLSQRIDKANYPTGSSLTIDLMYADLKAVIEHFNNNKKPVIIFGHSWGAMLATGFAGRYPNLLSGLILCEPGGLKWNDVEDYVKRSRSLNIWSEALNNTTYIDQFITAGENDHAILDYKMSMFASSNPITGEGVSDKSSFWRSGAVISTVLFDEGKEKNLDFSAGINQLNKKVLFFYSEKNKAYPESWMSHVTSVFKNVKVVKISSVGHDGIITNKKAWDQETKPQVIQYLNSLQD